MEADVEVAEVRAAVNSSPGASNRGDLSTSTMSLSSWSEKPDVVVGEAEVEVDAEVAEVHAAVNNPKANNKDDRSILKKGSSS